MRWATRLCAPPSCEAMGSLSPGLIAARREVRPPTGSRMLQFLPSRPAGEGNHAEHGGGITGADVFYPSTIQSSLDGSPPHELRSQRGTILPPAQSPAPPRPALRR